MADQYLVFAVIALAFLNFAWGKVRYDAVGLVAMIVLAFGGVLPGPQVFHGFANDAVLSVISVMVAGRALRAAGTTEPFAALLLGARSYTGQMLALTGTVAFFSSFMNNTGALAVFLPVTIHMARKLHRLVSTMLMPLAFAALLGGLVTLLGTPPNILVSTFRQEHVGEAYGLFDFTPVGIVVAAAGIIFLATVGWRLVPARRGSVSVERLLQMQSYFSEVLVPSDSPFASRPLQDLQSLHRDVNVVGLVRGRQRVPAPGAHDLILPGDLLLVEAAGEELQQFAEEAGLSLAHGQKDNLLEEMGSEDVELQEVVVAQASPLIGRTARGMRMRWRFGVNLLAISRRGARIVRRLPDVRFRAGDVMLIQVRRDSVEEVLQEFKVFSLVDHEHPLPSLPKLFLTVGIFGVAMALVAMRVFPLGLTFLAAAILLVMTGVLSARQAYSSVDWPVIVLLGSTICLGSALEYTGGAETIASGLLGLVEAWPGWAQLLAVMVTTMLVSNVVNNAATAVMMAPIAWSLAVDAGHSPDAFLMGVAVAASSCFLTPIGHQCNILVLGPGGYRFSDYFRPGLPLSIIVLAVGLAMILVVWPL
jgi:di/tricarboxylate transporter